MQKFSIAKKDIEMTDLVEKTSQKLLAKWAIACSKRVLHYFKEAYTKDNRPELALITLQNWLKTGKFSMRIIRKASLDSHKAAKEMGNSSSAASVAHACGQAVATAHVPRHAYGAAIYAQQAIFRSSDNVTAFKKVKRERDWQFRLLKKLNNH